MIEQTIGKMDGHIKFMDIFDVIKKKFDNTATITKVKLDILPFNDTIKEVFGNEREIKHTTVHINFLYKGEQRILYYEYMNYGYSELLKENTLISMLYSDASIGIMVRILEEFGGYLRKSNLEMPPREQRVVKNVSMRQRSRIPLFLEELSKVWNSYPDLRLGQMMSILTKHLNDKGSDLFYIEDKELINELKNIFKGK